MFSTDAVVAFTVFVGLVTVSIVYATALQNSLNNAEKDYDMKEAALRASNQLLYSKGSPANWEYLASIDDINSIGLVQERSVIDGDKLARLVDLNSSYSDAKGLFGAGRYNVGITINYLQGGQQAAKFGTDGDGNATVVTVARPAYYNGSSVVVRVGVSE